MKNIEVLQMAAALLTPAEATASSATDTVVALAAATPVQVSVNDPMVAERLRLLLETAVRMLYSKALLSGEVLPDPVYPLLGDGAFPLPDAMASVAACYSAWLFTGEDRLKVAWQTGLDGYLATLEAVISPIVERV